MRRTYTSLKNNERFRGKSNTQSLQRKSSTTHFPQADPFGLPDLSNALGRVDWKNGFAKHRFHISLPKIRYGFYKPYIENKWIKFWAHTLSLTCFLLHVAWGTGVYSAVKCCLTVGDVGPAEQCYGPGRCEFEQRLSDIAPNSYAIVGH